MSIKKVLIGVFTIFIIAQFIYLVILRQKVERLSLAPEPKSQRAPESPVKDTAADDPQSSGHLEQIRENKIKIREAVLERLSEKYQKPIEEVIPDLEQKLQEHPDNADIHYELGEIYLYYSQERALVYRHFSRALELCANHPQKEFMEHWLDAIASHTRQREKQRELENLQKFITLHPKDPEGYVSLADHYREQRFNTMAALTYKKALKLSPKDADLYFRIGLVTSRDNYQESLEHFKKALELKPDHLQREEIAVWIADLETKVEAQRFLYSEGKVAEADLIGSLRAQLDSGSVVQQRNAIRRLGTLKSEEAAEMLLSLFVQPGEGGLQREVIQALCRMGTEKTRKFLEEKLFDPKESMQLKRDILASFRDWGEKEELQSLEKWLKNADCGLLREEGERVLREMQERPESK